MPYEILKESKRQTNVINASDKRYDNAQKEIEDLNIFFLRKYQHFCPFLSQKIVFNLKKNFSKF